MWTKSRIPLRLLLRPVMVSYIWVLKYVASNDIFPSVKGDQAFTFIETELRHFHCFPKSLFSSLKSSIISYEERRLRKVQLLVFEFFFRTANIPKSSNLYTFLARLILLVWSHAYCHFSLSIEFFQLLLHLCGEIFDRTWIRFWPRADVGTLNDLSPWANYLRTKKKKGNLDFQFTFYAWAGLWICNGFKICFWVKL